MNASRRRRSMDDLMQDQERQSQAGGAPGSVPLPRDGAVAVMLARSLPDPVVTDNDGELSTDEAGSLSVCEGALDNLRLAFAAAGKALQVIRDGRLYRATHPSFEAYVEARWGMARGTAYRLIAAWPLAERLSPIGDSLNESQVRELVPLASQHGEAAAETVYRAVAETEGINVTAGLLRGAVAVLPTDHFDAEKAVSEIRAYLAGERTTAGAARHTTHADGFSGQAARVLRDFGKVAQLPAIRNAEGAQREEVRRFIDEARHVLDNLEKQLSP